MTKSEAQPVKQAAIVVGALAAAWLAIEVALKPILHKFRSNMDKADPSRDPDDTAAKPANSETAPAPAPAPAAAEAAATDAAKPNPTGDDSSAAA